VVQYYFLTLDLYAIFNVFLCYALLHADFPHGHGWLARKRRRLIKPFCRVSRTSLGLEYITSWTCPSSRTVPTFRPDHRPPRAPDRVSTLFIPATALSILRRRRSPSDFKNSCGF
jgi:hypothetical protein